MMLNLIFYFYSKMSLIYLFVFIMISGQLYHPEIFNFYPQYINEIKNLLILDEVLLHAWLAFWINE